MKVTVSLLYVTLAVVSASPAVIKQEHSRTEVSTAPSRDYQNSHAYLKVEKDNKYTGSQAQANLRHSNTDNAHVNLVLDTDASHPNVTHSAQNAAVAVGQAAIDAKDEVAGYAEVAVDFIRGAGRKVSNAAKWVGRQTDNALTLQGHNQMRMFDDATAGTANFVNKGAAYLHKGTESFAESAEEAQQREYALAKNARAKIAMENEKAAAKLEFVERKAADGYHAVADKVVELKDSAAARIQEAKEAAIQRAEEEKARLEQEAREREVRAKHTKKVNLKTEEKLVKPAQYATYTEDDIVVEETDSKVLAEENRLKAQAKLDHAKGVASQKLAQGEAAAARQAQRAADDLNRRAQANSDKANARFSASASEERAAHQRKESEVVTTKTTLVNNGTLIDSASNTTVKHANGTVVTPAGSGAKGLSATVALGVVVGSALLLL